MDDLEEVDEEWKTITGWPDYSVSNYGRVYNNRHGRYLKPSYSDGYLRVCLSSSNKKETIRVHVLVAEAFINDWFRGSYIKHIDGDNTYNIVDNLEIRGK